MDEQQDFVEIIFEGGNTNPLFSETSNIRNFCFTKNNYSEEDYEAIKNWLDEVKSNWIMGREGGTKTKHIQGYVELTKDARFSTVHKMTLNSHIEKRWGTNYQAWNYCRKEGNYETNFEPEKKLSRDEMRIEEKREKVMRARDRLLNKKYKDVIWKDWQQWFIDDFEGLCKDNYVNWIYDYQGQIGKNFLQKFMFAKKGWIPVNGCKADGILHAVSDYSGEDMDELWMMLNIPRTRKDDVDYNLLETLLDGLFMDSKYEGGITVLPDFTRVIVFANEPPDWSKLSKERWGNVWEIFNGKPVKRDAVVVRKSWF